MKRSGYIGENMPDVIRTSLGTGKVLMSVSRGGRAFLLIENGATLLLVPEPTLITKVVGGTLVVYGVVETIFSVSDAIEGTQDIAYGWTNQDKKSENPGRIILGEDEYDILNMVSGSGVPYAYQIGEYTKLKYDVDQAQSSILNNSNLISKGEYKSTSSTNSNLAEEYKLLNNKQYTPLNSNIEDFKNSVAEQQMKGVSDNVNYHHIINGEINAKGKAVGGHSLLNGTVKVDKLIQTYPNGVYKANISVKNPVTGQYIPKKTETTMYPITWSEARIKYEISEAFKNATFNDPNDFSKWNGISPSGINIRGYYRNGKIMTAFPEQ